MNQLNKNFNNYIDVKQTTLKAFLIIFSSGLVALDMLGDRLLAIYPKNETWYLASATSSTIIFLIAIYIMQGRKNYAALLDLCFYDILIQILGYTLKIFELNPTEPTIIPYQILAVTMVWLKGICAIWPLILNNDWPIIGPVGYFKEKNYTQSMGKIITPLTLPHGLTTVVLLLTPPIIYMTVHVLLTNYKSQALDVRWLVYLVMAWIYLKNAKQQQLAIDELDKHTD